MNKNKFLFIFLVLINPSFLFASGVGLTTFGSRAIAMGGAYRSLSDDWSGIYWNPAGIGQIRKKQLGFSISTIFPIATLTPAKFTDLANPDFQHSYYGYTTSEVNSKPSKFYIPSFGFIYPRNEKLTLGFGLFVPFGLGAKWDIYNLPVGYSNEKYKYPDNKFKDVDNQSNLQILDFHPTVGYNITPKFMLGLGIGIVNGEIKIQKTNLSNNPLLGGRLNLLVTAPKDKIASNLTLDGSGISFSVNGGVIYKPYEELSIGVSFRYYSDITLSGDAIIDVYFPKVSGVDSQIDTLIKYRVDVNGDRKWTSQDSLSLRDIQLVFSGTKVKETDKGEATLSLPLNFGVGIAYKPIQKLLISFDVDYTEWSVWDKIKIEYKKTATNRFLKNEASILKEEWKDAIRVSFGMEYEFLNINDKVMTLRLGFYSDPSPVPDKTISPLIPDINRKNVTSVGLGFGIISKLQFDLNYEHIFINDRKVENYIEDTVTGANENVAGIYTLSINAVSFGLSYNF